MSPPVDRDAVLDAGITVRRSDHAAKGHTRTSAVGYCAEPDGISATFCEDGFWLECLDRWTNAARAVVSAWATVGQPDMAGSITRLAALWRTSDPYLADPEP